MATTFELKFDTPGGNPISKLSPLIQSNVIRALQDGMMLTERIAQEKYMSGPRPNKLAVVTGLLRSRVKSRVEETRSPHVFATGILGVSGIKYGAIHEYGGTIKHPGSIAHSTLGMRFFWKRKGIWARMMKTKPHDIPIPARPYLRPALEESIPGIKNLIQLAISKAYGES